MNDIVFGSRSNPMGLIVALDDDGLAQGSLFWDDGEAIGMQPNLTFFSQYINLMNEVLMNYSICCYKY